MGDGLATRVGEEAGETTVGREGVEVGTLLEARPGVVAGEATLPGVALSPGVAAWMVFKAAATASCELGVGPAGWVQAPNIITLASMIPKIGRVEVFNFYTPLSIKDAWGITKATD